MENIIDIDISKPVQLQGSNSNFKIIGEDIEKPFIDYSGTGGEEKSENFYEIVKNDKTTITINPDFEYKRKHTVILHLPKKSSFNISAETNNGLISFQSLNGKLNANTRNGKIELEELQGTVTATCANGSINSKNIDGTIDFSSANGRISVRESAIQGESTVKSGNGRIFLQLNPSPTGTMSIFSGNGKVRLALPEHGNFSIQIKTKGRLFNNLEGCGTRTENEATIIQKGEGGFNFLINNYRGGVTLVKYEDIDTNIDEGPKDFFEDMPFGDFFHGMFKCFEPGDRGRRGFEDDISDFLEKMADFGSRFGKMGKKASHKYSHHTGRKKEDGDIRLVLEMLQEGRITAEEAEKLINAIKAKKNRY